MQQAPHRVHDKFIVSVIVCKDKRAWCILRAWDDSQAAPANPDIGLKTGIERRIERGKRENPIGGKEPEATVSKRAR